MCSNPRRTYFLSFHRCLQRLRFPLACAAVLVFSVACSEGPDVSDEQPEPSDEPWYGDAETVTMPWTHPLKPNVAEKAAFERTESGETRVSFPQSVADELSEIERYDIIASGSEKVPFAFRVVEIDRSGDGISFLTEYARLNEIFYKLKLGTGGFGPGRIVDDDPQTSKSKLGPKSKPRTKRQPQNMSNTSADYRNLGEASGKVDLPDRDGSKTDSSWVNKALDIGKVLGDPDTFTGVGGQCGAGGDIDVALRGDPSLEIDPSAHFRLVNEPPEDPIYPEPKNTEYSGTRNCTRDGNCARGETCAVPYELRQQGIRDEDKRKCGVQVSKGGENHFSCQNLIRAHHAYKRGCKDEFEAWWNGNRQKRTCKYRIDLDSLDAPRGQDPKAFIRIPYRAQFEWAKRHCSSGVRLFESEFKLDFLFKLKKLAFAAAGQGGFFHQLYRPGEGAYEIKEVVLHWWIPTPSGIPLYVNLTFRFKADLMVSATAGGKFGFRANQPLVIGDQQNQPLTLKAGGYHYYATPFWRDRGARELWKSASDYENGKPKLGELYQNQKSQDELSFQGPDLSWFGGGNFSMEGRLLFNVELYPWGDIIGYDFNTKYGLIFKPFEPYASLKVKKQTGSIDSAKDARCNVGWRAGIEGRAGIKYRIPFCVDCFSKFFNKVGLYSVLDTACQRTYSTDPTSLWSLYDTCQPHDEGLFGAIAGPQSFTCEKPSMCDDKGCDYCLKGCLSDCRPPPNEDATVNWVEIKPAAGPDVDENEFPDAADPDKNPKGQNDPQGIEIDQVVTEHDGEINYPEKVQGLERDWSWIDPSEAIAKADFQCTTANWRINYTCRGFGPYDHSSYLGSDPDSYIGDQTEDQCEKVLRCEDTGGAPDPDQCYHYSYASSKPIPPTDPIKPRRILTTEDSIKIKFQRPIDKCSLLKVVRLGNTENVDGSVPFYNGGPYDPDNNADTGVDGTTGQCGASGHVRIRLGTSDQEKHFGGWSKAFKYNKNIRVGNNTDCDASDDALWVQHAALEK